MACFGLTGHHPSIQEDTQINLWKTAAGNPTGALRQTGMCVFNFPAFWSVPLFIIPVKQAVSWLGLFVYFGP